MIVTNKQHFRQILLIWLGLLVALAASSGDFFALDAVVRAVQQRYGADAGRAVQDWHRALEVFATESEEQKLRSVNEYFNRRLRFDTDQNIWKQNDYWATPTEALWRGIADCEDYAIAKYFSLQYLGVPVAKLRITYVKARIGGPSSTLTQAHMVLTYYPTPDAEPLVLDNLVGEIRPASRRADLQPVFSFNSAGVWAAGSSQPQPGGGSRLTRWNDLLEKLKAEGFS